MSLLSKATVFFVLVHSTNLFAGGSYLCTTTKREGYYVKKLMLIENLEKDRIFVNVFDSVSKSWNSGSTGKDDLKKFSDHSTQYQGFNSEMLFGDLSEGAATEIKVKISSQIAKGQSVGRVHLTASGPEVGRESALYNCKIQ